MYFKLFSYLGKYKKQAILAPIAVAGEVVLEIYIPFLMAKIIDVGIAQKDLRYVVETGLLMMAAALLSLACGSVAARLAAVAAAGFAKEIRKAVFNQVQDFSFSNTDKFYTASLITRLTTDITFVKNSFMMIIRALVRSPLMMMCATLMAIQINKEVSLVFLIAIPFFGITLAFIAVKAHPYFLKMFEKYDAINASLQEMLTAIRVVKAFVREEYENKKFNNAVTDYADDESGDADMPDLHCVVRRKSDYSGKNADRRAVQFSDVYRHDFDFSDDVFVCFYRHRHFAGVGQENLRRSGGNSGY